jgi:formylglycine-generating enzyme required for sulfatase activity
MHATARNPERAPFAALAALFALPLASCVTTSTPAPGSSFRDCPDCPQMVVIPPGEFTMGFDGGEPERYEGPQRRITIGYAFAVGKYEVTNAEYGRFIRETGHVSGRNCNILRDGVYRPEPGTNWAEPGYGRPIRDAEPVVCIDWNDAKAFVAWLAKRTGQPYRLLSEAE